MKLWCIPVKQIGAYASPNNPPPTNPSVLYTHVIPSANKLPASLNTGPTKMNVKNDVTMIEINGVVRLSNHVGVTLCNFFSIVAKINATANTGSTVP